MRLSTDVIEAFIESISYFHIAIILNVDRTEEGKGKSYLLGLHTASSKSVCVQTVPHSGAVIWVLLYHRLGTGKVHMT